MKRYISVLLLLMAVILSVSAQSANRLYLQPVKAIKGTTVSLPFYLDNISIDIVGMQWDVNLPEGITLNIESAQLSADRKADHVVVVQDQGNGRYTFLVYSPSSKAIKANSGQILTVKVAVDESLEEDQTYPVTLTHVVLTNAAGENLATGSADGSITITHTPDFQISRVTSLTTEVDPGGVIRARWTVANIGEVASAGGWSERVVLVSADGEEAAVATLYPDVQSLAAGQSVDREAEITLADIVGVDGPVALKVEVVPDANSGESSSLRGNNVVLSANGALLVSKRLYLEIPIVIEEGKTEWMRGKLTRSGSRKESMTFELSLTGHNVEDYIEWPSEVTISEGVSGVSFEGVLKDNEWLNDAADTVATVSVTGNGYAKVEVRQVIIDDELPPLTLTASKTDVKEGENFTLTVAVDKTLDKPMTVNLAAEKPEKFDIPGQVTIDQGKTSASVTVEVVDDDVVDNIQTIAINARAEGFESGECLVMINDNDMPDLSFSLSPNAVSEGAGPTAVIGVIKRTTHLDKKVTLKITENSDGQLVIPYSTVVLKKGENEARFSVDVVDNDVVDGQRTFDITATVYASSCDCPAKGDGQGELTSKLTLLDDDVPALMIESESNVLPEESEENTIVVSRNTHDGAADNLTVKLSSDKDNRLVYNHQVVIPQGESKVHVNVAVKRNDVEGDDEMMTFTAEASGYAIGSKWLLISDQTLPDAVITNVQTESDVIEVGGELSITITLANMGNTVLRTGVPMSVKLNEKVVTTFKTGQEINPGDSIVIIHSFGLPNKPDVYEMKVVVNSNRAVGELVYVNNTSKIVYIDVKPTYTASIYTDKKSYGQGETVVFTGKAIGKSPGNRDVEIYVRRGTERVTIDAHTDNDGAFSATWPLPVNLVGHLDVGACYPGQETNDAMTSIEVNGVVTEKSFLTCEVDVKGSHEGSIKITNASSRRQTGIKVNLLSTSSTARFDFSEIKSIEPGKTIEIPFTIYGESQSKGRDWETMKLNITSEEGAALPFIVYYFVQPAHGAIKASPEYISTTIRKGEVREYPLILYNEGKAETGAISLSLPYWVLTKTPLEIASLQPGDSTIIMLCFNSIDDMQLNQVVTGHLGVNCTNGNGTSVGFSITPVSEEKGTLSVDVVDEFTFLTEEAPHVENATVTVTNIADGEVVAQGTTDENGNFTAELSEGWYNLTVEAENHRPYSGQVIVDAGRDKKQEVFVTYENITYSWNVEETGVDDKYEIETIVTFETRVPKPKVVMVVPDNVPQPNDIIPIKVTNEGWINVLDARISVDLGYGLKVEWLNSPYLEKLEPRKPVVFYAKVVESSHASSQVKKYDEEDCRIIKYILTYYEACDKYKTKERLVIEKRCGGKNCVQSPSSGGGGGKRDEDPGRPRIWGGSEYDSDYVIFIETVTIPCDNDDVDKVPCDKEPVLAYRLVTNTKQKRVVKGLAADGVSEVMILLDRSVSKIPVDNCEYKYHWTLDKNVGYLENQDSWDKVIYHAPKDFPKDEEGKELTITATLSYWSDGFPEHVEVPIKLIRTPVLLLHGLHDNVSCWMGLKSYLCNENNMYYPFQVMQGDYSDTNCASFMTNLNVASLRIDSLLTKCRANGYVVEKVDLIGHSMGGILSRLHVQYNNNQNVHKVITVNTPHSGSPLGDFFEYNSHMRNIIEIYHPWKFDTPAILDLGMNSSATDELLNNSKILERMQGVPVHSVSTNVTEREILMSEFENNGVLSFLDKIVGERMKPKSRLDFLNVAAYLNLHEFLTLFFEQADMVVPLESQIGGLTGGATWHYDGQVVDAFHSFTPKNRDIWSHLKDVLVAPSDSILFSKNGFRPVDLKYNPNANANANANATIVKNEREITSHLNAMIEDDSLVVDLQVDQQNVYQAVVVEFNASSIVFGDRHFKYAIPDEHEGKVTITAFMRDDDDNIAIDSAYVFVDHAKLAPSSLQLTDELSGYPGDRIPLRLVCSWENGAEMAVIPDAVDLNTSIARYDGKGIVAVRAGVTEATFHYGNLTCIGAVMVYPEFEEISEEENEDEEDSGSICSRVTLSFKQESVMTRQAFIGTLTVENGHEDKELKNLSVNIQVRDENGKLTTPHEFYIGLNGIDGLQGKAELDAAWTLGASGKGTVEILFIPTKYAAPTQPEYYSFGGTFSYQDPTTGLKVTYELNPVTLLIKPSPNLEMTYFMQRDVLGDDPLTEDVVEKSELSEFALIINNKGYGDAENMSMKTHQPEIIENKKGLLISFELVSTQLNGGEATLSLGGDMTSDFGTIPAHGQVYAQWWLKSSLMGHFVRYNVYANHLTSRGNPDLTLLDTVSIHELIRSVKVTETDKRAYIVNDIPDSQDQPDMAYLTDGTTAEVQKAVSMSLTRQSELEYNLVVSALDIGWVYGNMGDPTGGKLRIAGIVRNSDGVQVDLSNIWQTYVTLRDGKDPLYENRIHIADLLKYPVESYTLTFEPVAEKELKVDRFTGVPESGETEGKVGEVSVLFNKDIDNLSFTEEDVTLTQDGTRLDNAQIGVNRIDDSSFVLDVSKLTNVYGYYVLTVSTKEIFDVEGFKGNSNSSVAWLQYDPLSVRDLTTTQWKAWPYDHQLMIQSDCDMRLPVYTSDGVLWRVLDVPKGVSTHLGFTPGVYILRNRKVVISR